MILNANCRMMPHSCKQQQLVTSATILVSIFLVIITAAIAITTNANINTISPFSISMMVPAATATSATTTTAFTFPSSQTQGRKKGDKTIFISTAATTSSARMYSTSSIHHHYSSYHNHYRHHRRVILQRKKNIRLFLSSPSSIIDNNEDANHQVIEEEEETKTKKKRKMTKLQMHKMKSKMNNKTTASFSSTTSNTNTNTAIDMDIDIDIDIAATSISPLTELKHSGNIPDINWRAIPMNHLRTHPNFQPLPHPSSITQLHTLKDVRTFRQDSKQWTKLHNGRCTTSQAASALGFLEPKAAKVLNVPRGMQKRGSMVTYHRLKRRDGVLRTLDDMNSVLCSPSLYDDSGGTGTSTSSSSNEYENIHQGAKGEEKEGVWEREQQQENNSTISFAASYNPCMTKEGLKKRKTQTRRFINTFSSTSQMRIPMHWGNTQEPTSILTALNYFHSFDPNVTFKEVGMCGADLTFNHDVGLLLGATPDAVIQYSNGTLEALEVKNHCPFVRGKKDGKKITKKTKRIYKDNFRIRGMPSISDETSMSIPSVFIPQLMMEMMCLGDDCKSAVMCRQTALNGAIILRIKRDDKWINEMIYWWEKYMTDYVNPEHVPQQNFLLVGD